MIGFGTKTNTSKDIIQTAIDSGYNFIDTKDTNSSISYLKTLKYDRSKIFFCSKLVGESNFDNHKPKNVYNECIKSLKLAGLEYWDIYYIHTVHSFNDVNILDTYQEIVKLKNNKKILNIGLSNILYEQLETIILNSTKPDYIQIEIHPYLVEKRLVNYCLLNNIKVVAHSPLGSSLWKDISKEEKLIELSLKYKKSISQIILKWHISRGIIPIPSSNNIEHIKNNLDLNFEINQDDLDSITYLNKNKRIYVKPNHYESIGSIVTEPLKNITTVSKINNSILEEILKKGFYINNIINSDIYSICQKIEKEINTNKLNCKYIQSYGIQIINENCNKYMKELINNTFFINLFNNYFDEKYKIYYFIKKSIINNNLAPSSTGLYHRDMQKKSLKIIIYLTDVNKYNGPFKIIYPEIPENNSKITWYNDKVNKRTTEEQINLYYSPDNIISVEGSKYTIIIFDGNILHSGGYIQKDNRVVMYIEAY
jgi:diketogulonate reductase-like aldo/keto reductase